MEYLATGNVHPAEHELVLNKILCGYPVAAPITNQLPLEASFQELCDGLLEAAIQHWKAIGKTSITTFRETFLIRTGNLARTEKHWQLQINTKAYDVLLRQLPWGIATINLSWMERIMKQAKTNISLCKSRIVPSSVLKPSKALSSFSVR